MKQKQLQPLHIQLERVKALVPPDFGTLVQWEKRAISSVRAGGESNEDAAKAAHGQGSTGPPMPYMGETKVFFESREFVHFCTNA